MDEFALQAENELSRLLNLRKAALEEVSAIDKKIRALEVLLGLAKATTPRMPKKNKRRELLPIIHDVLARHGEPMLRGDLVKALKDRDVHINGTKPSLNLGTILWRLKDHFVNFEGYGYWPIDLPCKKCDYDPPKEAGAGGSNEPLPVNTESP